VAQLLDELELTVILRLAVVVCTELPGSSTSTVKEEASAAVGVPVIAPVVELRDNPAASWPDVIDQV
jgi:hypothetical protein